MAFLLKKIFRIVRFTFLAALIFILTVILFDGQVASYVLYAYLGIAFFQVVGFVLDTPSGGDDDDCLNVNSVGVGIETTIDSVDVDKF